MSERGKLLVVAGVLAGVAVGVWQAQVQNASGAEPWWWPHNWVAVPAGLAATSLILLVIGLLPSRVGQTRGKASTEPAVLERAALAGEPTQSTRSQHSAQPALDRNILRGRIHPHSYAVSVDPTETALVARAALAARIPSESEPTLSSDDERTFEDVVANSSFEAWLLDKTSSIGGPSSDFSWRSVEPTRSTIVSLRRPAAPMIADGWNLEGRSSLNLRPHLLLPPGWSILTLDAVVLPDGEEVKSRPLALEDFFELLYTLLSVLLDEIAPTVLPRITGSEAYQPPSVAVIATSSGRRFGDFVPLVRSHWRRAEGAYDPSSGEWEPKSFAEIETLEGRGDPIRGWIGKFLRDAGIRGHESDIDAMPTPRLRKHPYA